MKKDKRENIIYIENYKKNKDNSYINDESYIDEIVNQIVIEQEEHTEELIKNIINKRKKK